MEWTSHALLGKIAVRSLPLWCKEWLNFPPAGNELRKFPPCQNGMDQLAASCLLMDWVYEPEFWKYGSQSNGRQLPHMLPDADGCGAYFSGNAPDPGKFAEILTGLMQRTLQALKSGNHLEFTRWGGILGHFLQDITAPTHTISGMMLRTLFPDPAPDRVKSLGHYCYLIDDSVEISVPVCLGSSISQAVFNLTQSAFAAADRARSLIPALIPAAYEEDREQCRKILRTPVANAVQMTVDAWYTSFCIASDVSCPRPQELPLTQLSPLYHHPDAYAYSGPDVFCLNQKKTPLTVITEQGPQTFEHGFGMSGYSGMKFFLNGVFDRLDFDLALADIPDSEDPRLMIRFTIETDHGWNNIFSEDMEYGSKEILCHHIAPGDTIKHFTADISGAGTLIISAKAVTYQDEHGCTQFATTHIAVLNPILHSII